MLHQVAHSPMMARPRLTSSLPMIIVLGDNDASVTDSLAAASSSWFDLLLSSPPPTSAVSTFFRDAVTDHRFAILGVIVHESDDTAAVSMTSKTEICIARISPASPRNSHGQFSTLFAKISTLFLGIQTSSVQQTCTNESGDTCHPRE